MAKFNIAIIDDGVNINFFPSTKVTNYKILKNNVFEYEIDGCNIHHADICLAILLKNLKYTDVNIISLQILNESKHASAEELSTALKWLLNKDITLISLSIGTSYYKDDVVLRKIINKLHYKGVIIVAAQNNNPFVTYPAYYSNVIGVQKKDSKDKRDYYFNANCSETGIQLCALAEHQIEISRKKMITQYSNSFATPYISAEIINNLAEKKNFYQKLGYNNLIRFQGNSLYYQFNGCLNVAIICSDKYKKYILENYLDFNVVYKGNSFQFLNKMISDKIFQSIDTYILIDWDETISMTELKHFIEFPAEYYIIFKQKCFDYLPDKNILKKILFQQEEIYPDLICLNELKELDIPIVCISANKTDIYKLLKIVLRTRKDFFENDYNCRCISNISLFKLYDINYLENITVNDLKAAIDFYNIDILIFAIATDFIDLIPKIFDINFYTQELDDFSIFKQIVSFYSPDENYLGGQENE